MTRGTPVETATINPLAPEHLPKYIVAADGSDYLFTVMIFFTVGLILLIGILYLTLHAMPERMAHESNHSQMQIIGILALLALFTHNNLFWVVAILVAAFRPPDFMTPLTSIASSLATLAGGKGEAAQTASHPDSQVQTDRAMPVSEPASAPVPSDPPAGAEADPQQKGQ